MIRKLTRNVDTLLALTAFILIMVLIAHAANPRTAKASAPPGGPLASSPARASVPLFLAPVVFDSGGNFPWSIAVADLNGDGKLDLVVANANSSTVAVMLGNGYGWFQPPVTYPSGGQEAAAVVVADVNGDGIPDLIVTNVCGKTCPGGVVGVLLGNGDGTFRPAVTYSSGGNNPFSLAVADVNGDGHPDLVVGNDLSIGVLLGNGNGTFRPAVTYASGGLDMTYSLAVADLNRDGNLDVVVANGYLNYFKGGTVGVLLGNGDGTFQPVVDYNSGGPVSFCAVIRDLNGDGKPDLVVAGYTSMSVLLGNGDGTFQAPMVSDEAGWVHMIAVADVDGDGTPDLVGAYLCAAPNCTTSWIGVQKGNGDGTFQPAVAYPSGGPAFAVTVADLNGDGNADLLVSDTGGNNRTDSTVGVLLHNTPNTTSTSLASSLDPSTYGQAVTFTAKVTPKHSTITATGSVAFYDGVKMLGLGTLAGGTATYTTASLSGKAHVVTAVYTGSEKLAISRGSTRQVVEPLPTTTTLASSANPSSPGQAVTFTATVSSNGPTPTGKVRFLDGTTFLGTAQLSGGAAKLTKSKLAVGMHSISAKYLGDDACAKSTSSLLDQVVQSAR